MKILKNFVLLCSLFLLILTGCSSNDGSTYVDKLVGVWKISPNSTLAQASKGPNVANSAELGQKLDAMVIDLKPDMTFSATFGISMSGTWTVDGSGLVTMNSTSGSLSTISGGVNLYCQFDETNNTLTQQNKASNEKNDSGGLLVFSKQ